MVDVLVLVGANGSGCVESIVGKYVSAVGSYVGSVVGSALGSCVYFRSLGIA